MTRMPAVALALVGTALVLGSCAPLVSSGYRLFMSEAVHTQKATAGEDVKTPPLVVAPGKLARIAVKAGIESASVQEESSGGKTGHKLRFRFPVAYRVLDDRGTVLAEQKTVIAWDQGQKLMSSEHSTIQGGTVEAQYPFEKFAVPEARPVVVALRVDADRTYGARMNELELLVFDNQVSETPYVVAWLAMLLGGTLLAFIGFVLAMTSAARVLPTEAGTVQNADQRRYAALCHAAGFAGFLLPLGHIVGVVVAWLAWRQSGAFVDEQGKEALNFQITVTIYAFVCVLLILVVIGFFLLVALAIAHLCLMVIAALNASNGRPFRYPLTLRFVK